MENWLEILFRTSNKNRDIRPWLRSLLSICKFHQTLWDDSCPDDWLVIDAR